MELRERTTEQGNMLDPGLETDALIVGGGPAGLKTAETISAEGHSVILVEREQEIGFPVHTSGATSLEAMRLFQIPEYLYHPITRLRICSLKAEAGFDSSEPIGCIIDVRNTYKYLADKAREKGATILTGIRAEKALITDARISGCSVTGQSSRQFHIRSKIVIDASGYSASISRQTGLHPGFTRFGVGSEYELIAPKCRQDEIVLIVGTRFAPAGYAWVFPWGKGRVRVGVGIHHADVRDDPQECLKLFLQEAHLFKVDLTGHEITEDHYGLVPAHGLAPHLVGDGIMAVGDAAGQASLVVGEGIRLSMLAGQLAGQVASDALSQGRSDRQSLIRYERVFRSRYGRNLRIGRILNERMASYDDDKWDDRIRLLRRVPIGLLAKILQSEFPIYDLMLWIAARPNLWPRMLRYGFKGLISYKHSRA